MTPPSMRIKTYFGFEFTMIGVALLSEAKTGLTYRGKLIEDWNVVIDFLHSGCERVGQSVYLIFAGEQLVYAGEYSGIFQERWLQPRNGLWYLAHSDNDFRIQSLLKSKSPPEISVWLCSNPFIVAPDGERWNISAAIERRIIRELQPEWNKRGRTRSTTETLLTDVLKANMAPQIAPTTINTSTL